MKDILRDLLSQDYENEILEFKEAKNGYDFNRLGKYFSALCNEANLKNQSPAWLVFGVRDKNKKIIGTQFRTNKANLHKLKAEVANHTTNRITFIEIYEFNTPDGRVVLFEIPTAPKGIPVSWKGHYYGRDGEELNALNLEEIERIRMQSNEEDWSIKICKGADLRDLSQEAILKARSNFKTKNPNLNKEINNWDDITFLNKAKVCIKGKITRAAILLLGKSESEHFISPATAKITWILKDRDNIEKDYAHFTCPLLLNTEEVHQKIRNLKYRYLKEGTLFPEEVDQFDSYIIREALNNCIAHQDYSLGGKISVIENEDGNLIFSNAGKFIPESVEEVIISDSPEYRYRNKFLTDAMVNLNMIDSIGSGIKKMFNIQKEKFFPLPDYEIKNNKVKVRFVGKVMDVNYARKLVTMPNLNLLDIILLDKVVKRKTLCNIEIKHLKNKNLIEGRKPNFYVSMSVAKATGEQSDYIKQRGIDDEYCQKMILDYLKEFGKGKSSDFKKVLIDKLSNSLNEKRKVNKIRNVLQKLRKDGKIVIKGKYWKIAI
ncbi:MAG: putative DNA binding domain-containing protein [Bacteroidales bacterium]|nr:putative DNA binding domain-containing protein [Bacteroidales bacterium]